MFYNSLCLAQSKDTKIYLTEIPSMDYRVTKYFERPYAGIIRLIPTILIVICPVIQIAYNYFKTFLDRPCRQELKMFDELFR